MNEIEITTREELECLELGIELEKDTLIKERAELSAKIDEENKKLSMYRTSYIKNVSGFYPGQTVNVNKTVVEKKDGKSRVIGNENYKVLVKSTSTCFVHGQIWLYGVKYRKDGKPGQIEDLNVIDYRGIAERTSTNWDNSLRITTVTVTPVE